MDRNGGSAHLQVNLSTTSCVYILKKMMHLIVNSCIYLFIYYTDYVVSSVSVCMHACMDGWMDGSIFTTYVIVINNLCITYM